MAEEQQREENEEEEEKILDPVSVQDGKKVVRFYE
jgi:hypothetical protein